MAPIVAIRLVPLLTVAGGSRPGTASSAWTEQRAPSVDRQRRLLPSTGRRGRSVLVPNGITPRHRRPRLASATAARPRAGDRAPDSARESANCSATALLDPGATPNLSGYPDGAEGAPRHSWRRGSHPRPAQFASAIAHSLGYPGPWNVRARRPPASTPPATSGAGPVINQADYRLAGFTTAP